MTKYRVKEQVEIGEDTLAPGSLVELDETQAADLGTKVEEVKEEEPLGA